MATGRIPDANTAPLTAKGDLYTYSTANARLAVGNNGDTLVADSAASTGLRYTAGVGLTQPVINGGFDVWQRGTSIAGANSNTYTADRWCGYRTGTTYSRQTTSDTTNLPFIQYCMRVQRDSGGTGTSANYLAQAFETVNSIPYAGKTVTLSFYARKGANYSAASDALNVTLQSGTGTDQQPINNFTGASNAISQDVTLTSTWQRFTITTASALSSTLTQLRVVFLMTPVGTAGAADYYEITGVQLDIGQTALPFRRSGGTIQGELAACQRYYYRLTATGDAFMDLTGLGSASATTQVRVQVKLPVTMRAIPTSIDFANLGVNDGVTLTALTGLTFSQASPDYASIATSGATGLTQYRPYWIRANNNTAGYLGFSAEL